MYLPNKSYDVLKHIVQVIIPAIASLYFGLASIWSLPLAEEVVGSLAVIATFLGIVLGVSNKQYYDSDDAFLGDIKIQKQADGSKTYSLELNDVPESIEDRKAALFKVKIES